MYLVLLRGLGRAPTFLVPIINPPFADNSPHSLSAKSLTNQVSTATFLDTPFSASPGRRCERPMTDTKNLAQRYERIYIQLRELLTKTENTIARMATVCALLHHKMPHFFWTGFYILRGGELIVAPYQGTLACQVLEKKKGVCWAGVERKKVIIVPDVHKFPDHIACDSRSNSEIVVPLFDEKNEVWAVLDVDSTHSNAFSEIDGEWLEKIVRLI